MTLIDAPAAVAPKGSQEFEGGHFYQRLPSGVWIPLYQEGGTFNLRDARKLRKSGAIVCPSTTGIFKVLHKQMVVDWVKDRVAEVAWDEALNDPGAIGGNKKEWMERVVAKADRASDPAKQLGGEIHKGIELAIQDREYNANVAVYVEATMEKRREYGVVNISVEQCVGDADIGYAGRCDEFAEDYTVVDLKSRKSKAGEVASYETDVAQTASYGYAKWGDDFLNKGRGLIFGISTTEPGVVTVHEYTSEDLRKAFTAFVGMVGVWNWMKKW